MSFNDSTIEPKNVFLGLLINRIALIEQMLYDNRELRVSLTMMMGLIDLLDDTSQKQLENERIKILTLLNGQYQKEEVYKIFCNINKYLHKTYLQEVSLGLIPASTLPMTKQAPSKEAVPTRLSSKLE